MKKKLLVFHPALAPYRIDLFNSLNEEFEANIYFFRKNLTSQIFDTNKLEKQLNFTPKYLTSGFNFSYKNRMIRFGVLLKIVLHNPDIILCSEFNIMTFLVVLFSKIFFPKTKLYSLCDDSIDVAKNTVNSRSIGRLLCLKLLNGIILGNEDAEEWYNKHFPKIKTVVFPIIQKEERIISILNDAKNISLEYQKQYKLENKKILLFVGRLVKAKNLKFLLEVYSVYISKNKESVLILVGDGEIKKELLTIVDQLEMKENVIFAGRYENEALYAWYRLADFFILPSISETFGAVVNESLIAGVPVICSNLAGASCLINIKNGKTFNPNDKEELLSIFNELLLKKMPTKINYSLTDSLMPYTFNQRTFKLMPFLKADSIEK